MARRPSSAKSTSRKQTGAGSADAGSTRRHQTSSRRRGSRQQARAFAARLTSVMRESGLTNAETVQRMREHLPEGEGFSQANISHYRSGRSIPRSSHLEALSQALGVKASDLIKVEASGGSKTADVSSSVQGRRTGRERRAGRKQSSSRRRVLRVSSRQRTEPAKAVPVLQIEDLGTEVRIRLDQSFPWDTGMRLIQALKTSGAI